MVSSYGLMEYYIRYLRVVRKLSESSINHYTGALKYISKYLAEKNKIETSIYEISDIGELKIIREYLYNEPEFSSLDKRGHQMYSAGLNNYLKFANGEGFENIHKGISMLDMKVPVGTKLSYEQNNWRRLSIIKTQIIESAHYKREINASHSTFTAKSTGRPYMEGHHAIPMSFQDKFDSSLDIYANIMCLCPICHRLLHHGVDYEKGNLLNQIYDDRSKRLSNCGIRISKNDFFSLVV